MFGKPKEKSENTLLPMVPIRDVVLFPYMMIPFVIGRPASVKALEVAFNSDKTDLSGHPARCRGG